MTELNHTITLYDIKPDKVLEIVHTLKDMGVQSNDFEFAYSQEKWDYTKLPIHKVESFVKFQFRQSEYLTYLSLKYSGKYNMLSQG